MNKTLMIFAASLVLAVTLFITNRNSTSLTPHEEGPLRTEVSDGSTNEASRAPNSEPAKSFDNTSKEISNSQPPQVNKNKIDNLKNCYVTQDCDFPNNDPREYDIALGKALQQEILAELARARSSATERDLLAAQARELLKGTDDKFVHSACLEVLSSQEPSIENMDAVAEGLSGTADPMLMDQAMSLLKTYIGTPFENPAQAFLAQTIQSGAHFAGEKTAENIMPFINDRSLSYYENALKNMASGTSAKHRLESALKEYKRLNSGA